MIIDLGLSVFDALLVVLLSPLQIINISVNWFSAFDFIEEFFTIVVWILPWGNIMPLIIIALAIGGFKITIATIKTVWRLVGR